jgi:hypothetical protein
MFSTSYLGSAPVESTNIKGFVGFELSNIPFKSKKGVSIKDLSMLSVIRFYIDGINFSGLSILIIINF